MISSKIIPKISTVRQGIRPEPAWDVLRLDLLHPVVSGNKLYKLGPWIDEAGRLGRKGLLTFGGTWSNHIVATAFAAREAGLRSIGIIRGGSPDMTTATLEEARSYGMEIRYMDRTAFRLAREDRFRGLATGDPDHLLVPEGGFGLLGAAGAAGILAVTDTSPYTHLCCACGTGTMLAGIIRSSKPGQRCIGVDVVRQGPALDASVRELLTGTDTGNWETVRGYEIGGYARYTEALTVFMNRFHAEQGIPSDIVYTGKLFMAMEDMLAKGFFPPGSRILAIHSGGLQGNRSLIPGTLSF